MNKISSGFKKVWDDLLWGLIFIGIGGFIVYNYYEPALTYYEQSQEYKLVESKITGYNYNKDKLKAIIVEYKVDDKTYKKESDIYAELVDPIGKKVKIKYNEDDPTEAIFADDYSDFLLPGGGTLLILVGIIMIIVDIRKIGKGIGLQQEGTEQPVSQPEVAPTAGQPTNEEKKQWKIRKMP